MDAIVDEGRLHDVLALCEKAGVAYADLRLVRTRTESLRSCNGRMSGLRSHEDMGLGLRVLCNGAWGFAGNPDLDWPKLKKTVERAVSMARASAQLRQGPVRLSPVEPVQDSWIGAMAKDPFAIPLGSKIELLLRCDEAMARFEKIRRREGYLSFRRQEKRFLSSTGQHLDQDCTWSGGLLTATAADGSRCQQRSYPSPFRGRLLQGGWECIENLHFEEHARRLGREATMLLDAPICPPGETTLVLGKSQLALQVHESCGHATELDRVFGAEANFAGSSFLEPDMRGRFRFGSPSVTLVADATTAGAAGSYGWDDEGVPARRHDLVREGLFVGYQSGRDTACRLGEPSSGNMRAAGWNDIPIVRMSNVHLLPGEATFDELIGGVDEGLLMTDNLSWSIDDRRLHFQFAAEMAWRIRRGKICEALRLPVYHGRTPEFWRSCDGVADGDSWEIWGTPNCGKGQPLQVMAVGHGVSYARFRKVAVGGDHDF